jgi:hypothetical protein
VLWTQYWWLRYSLLDKQTPRAGVAQMSQLFDELVVPDLLFEAKPSIEDGVYFDGRRRLCSL